AATVLRSLDIEHVAQHPQERHVVLDVDDVGLAVDLDGMRHSDSARSYTQSLRRAIVCGAGKLRRESDVATISSRRGAYAAARRRRARAGRGHGASGSALAARERRS